MTNGSVRWAFNFAKWNPSYSDMLLAFSCVQAEEKDRLARFDVKSSLIGRLMMRKFVSESVGEKYNEVSFIRDDKEKPLLKRKENMPTVNFNVSHQGHYTVLAGEAHDIGLGVDVMKLEYTGGKSLSEFFRLMTKHFSLEEWKTIREFDGEKQQITMFCRLWCLKESYVKAIGVGITINTKRLSKDYIVKDTELYVRGEKLDWVFEEMLLDDDHCVAVALNRNRNYSDTF
ncbi:hypothetical protein NQ318_012768 [Aromia moschata]|uniref:L-aminoadipate-semialdehyde dehydrogenase-phosphopantetheinyl transferase n=1 Tax=Aromia moschata TaxID=1265417 RepID=A0AAV8YHK3_9CUCU|nr:hypothetical protein NQ318_012768 [Aromia moschata]